MCWAGELQVHAPTDAFNFIAFQFYHAPAGGRTTYFKFIVHCEEIIAASSADLPPPTLGPQPPSTFAQILDIFTKLKSYIHWYKTFGLQNLLLLRVAVGREWWVLSPPFKFNNRSLLHQNRQRWCRYWTPWCRPWPTTRTTDTQWSYGTVLIRVSSLQHIFSASIHSMLPILKLACVVQSAPIARSRGLVKTYCESSPGLCGGPYLQLLCRQARRRKLQKELPQNLFNKPS